MSGNEEPVSGPVLLNAEHDRRGFSCGEPALDEFLTTYALQQQKREASRTFVALRGLRVVAYYTLAPRNLEPDDVTETMRTGFGKYPIPVVLLGRLAVDTREQGNRLGEALLKHAVLNVVKASEIVGGRGLFVEAKHEAAPRFYARYGFEAATRNPLQLLMTVATIRMNLD